MVGLDDSFPAILSQALSQFPDSKPLWLARLSSGAGVSDYELAVSALPEDCDIWREYLTFLSSSNPEKCTEKWREVMKQGFSGSLSALYLQSVFAREGLQGVQDAFKELKSWNSVPECGYQAMLSFEKEKSSPEQVFQMYSELVTNYNSLSNWREFLNFCREQLPEKISDVIWKCKQLYSDSEIAEIL
eukprot:sb/3471278/